MRKPCIAVISGNSAGFNNAQITKNVGMLPYLFHRLFGWRAIMVGEKICDYPALDFVPGLEMVCLADGNFETKKRWTAEHAGEIDICCLHGLFPAEVLLGILYKQCNPQGKLYLETDANNYYEDRIPVTKTIKNFLMLADVVGVSCRSMQQWLSTKWPCRVDYLPNGFYDYTGNYQVPDFSEKEKIILTVGRLGTEQKRTEVLLQAFADVAREMGDWRLRLVGTVEEGFRSYIHEFFCRFPDLESRVTFTGPIYDKKELYAEYRRAAVFALSSIYEGGAPNVIAESLFHGCYQITTAIDAAEDITDGGRCGKVVPLLDSMAFGKALLDVAQHEEIWRQGGQQALSYAHSAYDFEKIAWRLYALLYGKEMEDDRVFADD